jgi:hypothetical protein
MPNLLDQDPMIPNLRYMAAQQVAAEVADMLQKHFENYGSLDAAYGRINRLIMDIEIRFAEKGLFLLSDEMRKTLGMAPVGPDGWTHAELLAYQAARLAALLRPIRVVLPAGDFETFAGDGSSWNKDPPPEGEKP